MRKGNCEKGYWFAKWLSTNTCFSVHIAVDSLSPVTLYMYSKRDLPYQCHNQCGSVSLIVNDNIDHALKLWSQIGLGESNFEQYKVHAVYEGLFGEFKKYKV